MLDEPGILTATQASPAACAEFWWGKRLRAVQVDLATAGEALARELLTDAWEQKPVTAAARRKPARPASPPSPAAPPRRAAHRPRSCSPARPPAAARRRRRSTACERKISPPALTRRQQLRVALVRPVGAEADDREVARRAQLPAGLCRDPAARTAAASATPRRMCVLQARAPVAAQHRPQLQGAEAAAERGAVLAQRQRVLGVGGAQVLGDQAEGGAQRLGPRAPQQRAVHRGEHPLVGVDDQRVGPLDPGERPAELGADHRRAGVGGVDVQPACRLAAQASAIAGDRVDRGAGGRADRGDDGGDVATGRRARRPQDENRESDAISRRVRPSIRAALATDECACSEQTTTSRPVASRAAISAAQRRGRGAVLDVAVPAAGQPEQLARPSRARRPRARSRPARCATGSPPS